MGTTVGDKNSSTFQKLTLPSDFREISVKLTGSDHMYKWNILKEDLPTSETILLQGSTNNNFGWIILSSTQISIHSLMKDGNYQTPTMTVYYR